MQPPLNFQQEKEGGIEIEENTQNICTSMMVMTTALLLVHFCVMFIVVVERV